MKPNKLIVFSIITFFLTMAIAVAQSSPPDLNINVQEALNAGHIDAGDAGEREHELNLLATITRDNGNTVEFYEPSPGVILISEAGKVPNEPLDRPVINKTAVELFKYLAPDQEVPSQLILAQNRTDELEKIITEQNITTTHSSPHQDQETALTILTANKNLIASNLNDSSCPKSWMEKRLSCSVNGDWDVDWYHRTGSTWFLRNDTKRVRVGACSYRGNITLQFKYRTWWDWHTQGSWTVNEGHYRQAWKSDSTFDFDIRSSVYNASGDGYHHCGYGFN